MCVVLQSETPRVTRMIQGAGKGAGSGVGRKGGVMVQKRGWGEETGCRGKVRGGVEYFLKA